MGSQWNETRSFLEMSILTLPINFAAIGKLNKKQQAFENIHPNYFSPHQAKVMKHKPFSILRQIFTRKEAKKM